MAEFHRGAALGDDNFELKLTAAGRTPKLVFQRKKGAGETAEDLRGRAFQVRAAYPPTRQASDSTSSFSFGPTVSKSTSKPGRLCSDRDLLAGWKAQTSQAEYSENLATDLVRFGPKPKPKPKPPTPPGQEPPKPQPAQAPAVARVGYRLSDRSRFVLGHAMPRDLRRAFQRTEVRSCSRRGPPQSPTVCAEFDFRRSRTQTSKARFSAAVRYSYRLAVRNATS